jgi:OOP family OmpA-OmpF porin
MNKSNARTLFTGGLLVVGALLAVSARAEGLYVGGNVGGSHDRGDPIGGLSTDRSGTGYKLYGGYSLNPYFGLETGYADLGHFNGDGGRLRARGLFLDAVGSYPLGYNFSVLGRLGVFTGRLNQQLNDIAVNGPSDDHGTGTSYKLGAGLQYDLSKSVALRGEWERYRFNALDTKPAINLFSVGVNYRF